MIESAISPDTQNTRSEGSLSLITTLTNKTQDRRPTGGTKEKKTKTKTKTKKTDNIERQLLATTRPLRVTAQHSTAQLLALA